tara:strand:+ start:182 stop:1639 length:1458 start_codon:yes stop_codon:yes gene_type:complete
MLAASTLLVPPGPGSGPRVSPSVFNAASLSSNKATIISESLKNAAYLTAVFTNRSPDDHIVFPPDPQSQERVVEIKNAIIVELLNQYRSKEAVLDEFPVVRDYIERSASENFKALVDSYSTLPVESPSSELVQIQSNRDVAIMSLLNPSFSKNIAQESFRPNFERISEVLDSCPTSQFEFIKNDQQSILASIHRAHPRSMVPSSRVSAAARRASGSLDGLGTSSSKFDGGHSVTSIEFAKRQYLDGIRTSAMLGFQECIIFSQFFKRPIVAVKNNQVDSVYGEEFFDTRVTPIFVVNYNNYHFEGWQPVELKDHYKPGDKCFGRKLPGNRAYNYGPNDCLIGSIRADVDANQALNGFYSNNQQIRAYLAQEHAQFSSSAAGYIADRSQFWKEQVFRVDDIDQNPEEIRNYAGINLIVTPVGKTIEDCDDSEIQRLSGDICNGRRHGTWFECDHTGRYEQVYVNGGKDKRTQTHRRGELAGLLIPV